MELFKQIMIDSLVAQTVKHLRDDPGLIPGSGRSPGEENGNPLQCSFFFFLFEAEKYFIKIVQSVKVMGDLPISIPLGMEAVSPVL